MLRAAPHECVTLCGTCNPLRRCGNVRPSLRAALCVLLVNLPVTLEGGSFHCLSPKGADGHRRRPPTNSLGIFLSGKVAYTRRLPDGCKFDGNVRVQTVPLVGF